MSLKKVLKNLKQGDTNMEFLSANWEYMLIALFCVDKVVALSPTKWDDLIWTSLKKALYKAVGK